MPWEPFMLNQPVYRLEANSVDLHWSMGTAENDPVDEGDDSPRPRIGVENLRNAGESNEPGESQRRPAGTWLRLTRDELIQLALDDSRRRVLLVCGAGLGKTTNLKWLEARLNRIAGGRANHLAVFLELRDLPANDDELIVWIVGWLRQRLASGGDEQLKFAAERMLAQGRITFLLDSLDQANPDPQGSVILALENLVKNRWSKCRVWVSGRPYAFLIAENKLKALCGTWQFLRIGPLDEPECRQLLEIVRRPDSR